MARRLLHLGTATLICALAACLIAVAPAAAEEPPLYGDSFPEISGPTSPEEFTFRVELNEGEYLEQVSPTVVGIFYGGEEVRLPLLAVPAHDAERAPVPTTLSIAGPEEITLTVHHRAGSLEVPGEPFAYPIDPGAGIDGIKEAQKEATELYLRAEEERRLRAASPPAEPAPPPTVECHVPKVVGLSRHEAAAKLRAAHCALGAVHLSKGSSQKAADAKGTVVKQFRTAGEHLAAGTPVAIKLATPAPLPTIGPGPVISPQGAASS